MRTLADIIKEKQVLSSIAMPADTNAAGKIFGGWLLAQMDLAASVIAIRRVKSRVVTKAVDNMVFIAPVEVGDKVNFYADIEKVGNTSITVNNLVTVERFGVEGEMQVASGQYIYVALDKAGKPKRIE